MWVKQTAFVVPTSSMMARSATQEEAQRPNAVSWAALCQLDEVSFLSIEWCKGEREPLTYAQIPDFADAVARQMRDADFGIMASFTTGALSRWFARSPYDGRSALLGARLARQHDAADVLLSHGAQMPELDANDRFRLALAVGDETAARAAAATGMRRRSADCPPGRGGSSASARGSSRSSV